MAVKKSKRGETKVKEITFNCQSCGQNKSFSEMVVLTTFFPPLVTCRDCERKMR